MRLLTALAAAILLATPAAAQEPSMLGIPCHVSAGAGLGVGGADLKVAGASIEINGTNIVGTLGVGCDLKVGPAIVGGYVDTTIGDRDVKFSIAGDTARAAIDTAYGFGVRAGYMVQPTTLIYGKLGWNFSEIKLSAGGGGIDKKIDGVSLGGGLETQITGPLWLRLDYAATLFQDVKIEGVTVEPIAHTAYTAVVFKF